MRPVEELLQEFLKLKTSFLSLLYLLQFVSENDNDRIVYELSCSKTVHSPTHDKFANPALASLLQDLQDVFGVHARGDELRAGLHHCGEHAFSVQIHERHAAHVNHAFAIAILP